jgi:hypothetical protein
MLHALRMDAGPIRSGFVRTSYRAPATADDGEVADNAMRDRSPGHKPRARRPHGSSGLFSMEPEVVAVLRLVVAVAALWAVLFVVR